jgi:hypothetical protein
MKLNLDVVAGIAPTAKQTFSRGYLNTGKVHFVPGLATAPGSTVTTICGRTIVAHDLYGTPAEKMIETHKRMKAARQVTHTCDRCVTKAA